MGLLDVNMPMLYGEGKKAFHRLQMEIIRSSNDQSIFIWSGHSEWTGSILADDPEFFQCCSQMELMDHAEFIEVLKTYIPAEELPLIKEDRFGTFPITNRGIHIWMLLDPYHNSDSVFKGILPCRHRSQALPVSVNLALWNSNYYRYPMPMGSSLHTTSNLQFRQIYLRYQGTLPSVTFEIDDSALVENGFAHRVSYPRKYKENTGSMLTVTNTFPLCARLYSNGQSASRLAVTFGQCFGHSWVHPISCPDRVSKLYEKEMVKRPERARRMADVPSRDDRFGRIWVNYIRLPGWIVQTSSILWERSRTGVRIEAFRDTGINISLNEWQTLDVQVGGSRCMSIMTTIIHRESMIPFVI